MHNQLFAHLASLFFTFVLFTGETVAEQNNLNPDHLEMPRYDGPLFDAMAQIDQKSSLVSAMRSVEASGVDKIALFARTRKALHQDEKALSSHSNVYVMLSKKLDNRKSFGDKQKQARIGRGMLDKNWQLKPGWRELVIRYAEGRQISASLRGNQDPKKVGGCSRNINFKEKGIYSSYILYAGR